MSSHSNIKTNTNAWVIDGNNRINKKNVSNNFVKIFFSKIY